MKLKLTLEQTGQQWTLKPNREYIIGTDLDCDIVLDAGSAVGKQHLKLSFNANNWHLLDLGSSLGTFINNQPVTDYWLTEMARIRLGNGCLLLAVPEGSTVTQPTSYQPPTAPPPSYQPPTSPVSTDYGSGGGYPSTYQQPPIRQTSSLPVLTWAQFVNQQINQHSEPVLRFSTWFHMITGYRNTPWVRGYGSEANNFNAFDGYVIPNFKGSVETVITAVRDKIGLLRNYENTDSFVARLTDAHIADSATQRFFGVELFAIVREKGETRKADYRDFIVISYHRVRTYLLIEKYGTDLFVSWITRFEPAPTAAIMILWCKNSGRGIDKEIKGE